MKGKGSGFGSLRSFGRAGGLKFNLSAQSKEEADKSAAQAKGGSMKAIPTRKPGPTPTPTPTTPTSTPTPAPASLNAPLPEIHDDVTYDPEMPQFDVSDLNSYSPNHALWTAYASALVYLRPELIEHVVLDIWGWSVCECFVDELVGVSAFGMVNDKVCIIAVAGDGSDSGMATWTTKPRCNSDKPFIGYKDALIHHGFNLFTLSLATSLREFIKTIRENNPELPVFLTGHSVGGSIASLMLAYCTFETNMKMQLDYFRKAHGEEVSAEPDPNNLDRIPITAVYTFGSPRVGSIGFRKALRDATPQTRTYRIVNMNDIVPELPGSDWHHFGNRVFITEQGLSVGKVESKKAMERFKAEMRTGGYVAPDIKFHQIRFYLFALEQYWNAYLAEIQMKRSLQSSFAAFPEARTAPKPQLATQHHQPHEQHAPPKPSPKKLPPTPAKQAPTPASHGYDNFETLIQVDAAHNQQPQHSPRGANSTEYSNVAFLSALETKPHKQPFGGAKSQPSSSRPANPSLTQHESYENIGLVLEPERPKQQTYQHPSGARSQITRPPPTATQHVSYENIGLVLVPEKPNQPPQQPSLHASKKLPVPPQARLHDSDENKQITVPEPTRKAPMHKSAPEKSPSTEKEKNKKKDQKTIVPVAGRNQHGVYILDSAKKKVYPLFRKLVFVDENLKLRSAIAEREPNDMVCYILVWRRPALAHGGPIKFRVELDGEFLEHHPLANGYYLFLGVNRGEHVIGLTLPGSVTHKTDTRIKTEFLEPGELQIIEVKIGGTLLPKTKVLMQPKFNWYESIWGGQSQEK